MKQNAVIDRFVDRKYAVLLVGLEETEVTVPIEDIPGDAKEGSWVTIDEDGMLTPDYRETELSSARISDKLSLLKSRNAGSKFRKR